MTPAETTRRLRVIAANEALRDAGLWHQPAPNVYRHAPYCPPARCCCTGMWVQTNPDHD